jgi:hypothetical protein
MIVEAGQSPWGRMPPEIAAERRRVVEEQGAGLFAPPPPVAAFGVPEDHERAAWVRRRLTPHPAGTYRTPLRLDHSVGNGLPCTYIACTDPWYARSPGCGTGRAAAPAGPGRRSPPATTPW